MNDNNDRKKNPLDSALLKGFLAGVLFSHINKRFLLGSFAGIGVGMFIEQNYNDIPDVKKTLRDCIDSIKSATKPK